MAQAAQVDLPHVVRAEEHAAALRHLEPQQQAHDGRFPAPALAHDGDVFARAHLEREVAKDVRGIFAVAERHARHLDVAGDRLDGRLALGNFGDLLENGGRHLEHGADLRDLAGDVGELENGHRHLPEGGVEGHEVVDGHASAACQVIDCHHADEPDERDDSGKRLDQHGAVIGRPGISGVAVGPLRESTLLCARELDLLDAAQKCGHFTGELRIRLHRRPLIARCDDARHGHDDSLHDDDGERRQGERRRERAYLHDVDEREQGREGGTHDHRRKRLRKQRNVRNAAREITRRVLLEERRGQRQHARKRRSFGHQVELCGNAGHDQVAANAEQGGGHRHAQQERRHGQDEPGLPRWGHHAESDLVGPGRRQADERHDEGGCEHEEVIVSVERPEDERSQIMRLERLRGKRFVEQHGIGLY